MEGDGSRHLWYFGGDGDTERATATMFTHRYMDGRNSVTRRVRTGGECKYLAIFERAVSLNKVAIKSIEVRTLEAQ
jgi:hypothetical protein